MIVDHERKYIFIHIPKTGGTAITETLIPHLSAGSIGGDGPHKFLHYHAPAREAIDAFKELCWDWHKYTSVTVIRNPFEVLHSDYWFHRYIGGKLFPDGPPAKDDPEYAWHLKCYGSQFITFTEYCLREYGHWDRGFYQQYCCGRDKTTKLVTTVFRHERIDGAWNHAKSFFNLPADMPLARINATSQVSGKQRPAPQDDYTPELVNFVKTIFKDDLDRFGFTLEGAK